MRKEILFAIIAGGIFGLIIAFGIWRLNSTFSNQGSLSTEGSPTPTPSFGLTIANPTQNEVITTKTVEISGITKPGSWVVTLAEDEDFMVQAETDGSFAIEVDLVGGINQLQVLAYDESGSFQQQNLTVVYSSEFAETLEEEVSEEDTNTEETDVEKRVQEKIREAQNQAIAYIGTVTDISGRTIQIRTTSGEIVQVAVAETATFATTVGTAKTIEFEDVALGDFAVAMGFVNGNNVLDARRVLVVEAPEEPSIKAVFGTIETIERREVTLSAGGETWTLNFPTTWKGPETSELNEGDTLIATGTADEEKTLSIRSIFQTIEEIENETSEE